MKSATIRDVAALARVSVGTVSAVINQSPSVSESTRQRVLGSIETLSYNPNSNARSLKRPSISSIGLVVPDLQNPFFASVAEGVQEAVELHDVLVVLCMTGAREEREKYYARTLHAARLDGVIYLSGSGIPSPELLQLSKRQQILLIDERVPGIDIPFVSAQNRQGAFEIAKHLLWFGHSRVGIIGGPPRLWTSEQRLAGYREALIAASLDPNSAPMIAGDYTEASGYSIAQSLMANSVSRPTALLCANDLMAIGALRFCRQAGLRIPYDVSITGFDNIPTSSLVEPPLTTVSQPGRDMGRAAALLLLHQIKGTEAPEVTDFPTTLCIRSSVSPPATVEG